MSQFNLEEDWRPDVSHTPWMRARRWTAVFRAGLALEVGELDAAAQLIEDAKPVTARTVVGVTGLEFHLACRRGELERARALLADLIVAMDEEGGAGCSHAHDLLSAGLRAWLEPDEMRPVVERVGLYAGHRLDPDHCRERRAHCGVPRDAPGRPRHGYALMMSRRCLNCASYIVVMPVALVGSEPEPCEPRVVVLRDFGQVSSALALANASRPVLAVLRMTETDRSRVIDTLAGWAIGSGGEVDMISRQTVAIRSAACPPVRLSRPGIVSAVQEAFEPGPDHPLTRDEEARLFPRAVAGDAEARRRLVDSYAEIATVVALWLRPDYLSADVAVARAQRELDQLVCTGCSRPALVELVDRLATRLGST